MAALTADEYLVRANQRLHSVSGPEYFMVFPASSLISEAREAEDFAAAASSIHRAISELEVSISQSTVPAGPENNFVRQAEMAQEELYAALEAVKLQASIADARNLIYSQDGPGFDLDDEDSRAIASDYLQERGFTEEVANLAVVPEVVEEPERWEVFVGNIGQVYDGDDEEQARHQYEVYVEQSQSGAGRVAGEGVLLQLNGEIVEETEPEPEPEPEPQEDDLVTQDGKNFYSSGRLVLTVEDDETVEDAVRAWMADNQYYPSVWNISDHGNAHLMEI